MLLCWPSESILSLLTALTPLTSCSRRLKEIFSETLDRLIPASAVSAFRDLLPVFPQNQTSSNHLQFNRFSLYHIKHLRTSVCQPGSTGSFHAKSSVFRSCLFNWPKFNQLRIFKSLFVNLLWLIFHQIKHLLISVNLPGSFHNSTCPLNKINFLFLVQNNELNDEINDINK